MLAPAPGSSRFGTVPARERRGKGSGAVAQRESVGLANRKMWVRVPLAPPACDRDEHCDVAQWQSDGLISRRWLVRIHPSQPGRNRRHGERGAVAQRRERRLVEPADGGSNPLRAASRRQGARPRSSRDQSTGLRSRRLVVRIHSRSPGASVARWAQAGFQPPPGRVRFLGHVPASARARTRTRRRSDDDDPDAALANAVKRARVAQR